LVKSVLNLLTVFARVAAAVYLALKHSLRPASVKSAADSVSALPFSGQLSGHSPVVARALSAAAQWSRVSAVVELSVQRAQGIGAQQAAARQQLDAADYGLQQLIEDLNGVMSSPVIRLRGNAPAPAFVEVEFVQALAA
jgi:hypothetical protein